VLSAVSTTHLRLNTGRSQTPQTKWFAHAVVCSDLRGRFPSRAESDQAFARKEKGGTEPIGFLLLLIRVITQEQQTRFRYFHAHWRMAQFNMCELVHQVRSLAGKKMAGVENDAKFSVYLERHRRPAVGIVNSQLGLCLFRETQGLEIQDPYIQVFGVFPRV
jgi:hypothetical protein